MNKRGQSLPLNTVIIIILIVIALIVIAVFFLGGTSKLSESIRNIFYGTTQGTDETLAVRICEQRCEEARDTPPAFGQPAFCRLTFDVDRDANGQINKDATGSTKEKGLTCPELGITCGDVCKSPPK